ncbi:MAG: hypothetical protein J6584_07110 [Lactobacillus sp.]|nr:hypothetical protein [Lactobacillus sp.]
MYTNRGGAKGQKYKRIITYGEKFYSSDLIRTAHSVRLFDGRIYINLDSGIFVQDMNVRNIKTLDYVYKEAKTVMDSQHRLIAKRLKAIPNRVSRRCWEILQHDPDFCANDYQLRHVRVQLKKLK